MGEIVLSENVTLDAVIQDPTGDEGFRAGHWAELGAVPPGNVLVGEPMFLVPRASVGPAPGTGEGAR